MNVSCARTHENVCIYICVCSFSQKTQLIFINVTHIGNRFVSNRVCECMSVCLSGRRARSIQMWGACACMLEINFINSNNVSLLCSGWMSAIHELDVNAVDV